MTGQLEEEKMQVYVRLGIRLLYKVSNVPLSLWHYITIEPFFFAVRALARGWRAREVRYQINLFFCLIYESSS
jgi:hypothetical protein